MIRLDLSDDIIKSHRDFLKGCLPSRIKEFKKECKLKGYTRQHVKFCNWLLDEVNKLSGPNYRDTIFLMRPEKFDDCYEYIQTNYPKIIELIKNKVTVTREKKNGDPGETENISYSEWLMEVLGYEKCFSAKKPNPSKGVRYSAGKYKLKAGDWGAYAYIMSMGLKVCPYCNRAYITSYYYSEDDKVRPDLDHFLPKAEYPFFSVSIYNLIPSCKVCNSSMKGKKKFSYAKYINPFEKEMSSDLMRFDYDGMSYAGIIGLKEEDINITLKYDKKDSATKRLKNNNKTFGINNLYQYHGDVVCELLKKQYMYDEVQKDSIFKTYKGLFADKNEMNKILFGFEKGSEENTLLGKLKSDIYDQFESIRP